MIKSTVKSLLGVETARAPDAFESLPDTCRPRSVIDVGVADGTPSLYARFPDAHLTLIEPNPTYHDRIRNEILNERDGALFTFAAGAEAGKLELKLEGRKSSFLQRTELGKHRDRPVETAEVPVRPLGDVPELLALEGPVLLKIDCEGFELEVLKGLGALADHVDYLVL